ncbi:MAG: iron-containing alcohol dehydrogenase [Deltaproteobacteria bacterium]|nr:iron-containing alcohol dehydrogenase [Deltaproteobacteria bacterium]
MTDKAVVALRKFVAPEIVFGANALDLAGQAVLNLGGLKALVVSDPGVVEAGWTDRVLASLDAAGVEHELFTAVTPNPRAEEVALGAERYRAAGCDALVAVGGGSPMDCAKGIGIVAANRRPVLEFEGVDEVAEPMPPMVCVPTTCGSSADVSQFAIITHRAEQRKIAIVSKAVVPDVSLVDPRCLSTMSRYLAACTALDTLTHAIEALVSLGASALTNLHAMKAIGLLGQRLQEALRGPELTRLDDLMFASLQAGLAFSNASLGAVHAVAHSLGGKLDLPHGECNALLLEHVVDFNFDAAEDGYRAVAETLGLEVRGQSSARVRSALVGYLRELREALGVSGALEARGVKASDVRDLAATAMRDACLVTNPRRPTPRDLEVVLELAL